MYTCNTDLKHAHAITFNLMHAACLHGLQASRPTCLSRSANSTCCCCLRTTALCCIICACMSHTLQPRAHEPRAQPMRNMDSTRACFATAEPSQRQAHQAAPVHAVVVFWQHADARLCCPFQITSQSCMSMQFLSKQAHAVSTQCTRRCRSKRHAQPLHRLLSAELTCITGPNTDYLVDFDPTR